MTLHLGIPLLVSVVGGVMYLAMKDKPSEMGRLAFFAGLLATLMHYAGAAR